MRRPMGSRVPLSLVLAGLVSGCESAGSEVPLKTQRTSGDYGDLLTFFEEWRLAQAPSFQDGVPDYTPAGMRAQHREVAELQARLAAINPSGWPVEQQVDFRLVQAEVNGLDFDHRVMRPWSRMPSFYKVVLPAETDVPAREGQVMHGAIELWTFSPPLDPDDEERLRQGMRAIPHILDQARSNLVEDARDLWILGIRGKERESLALEAFALRAEGHHPDLAAEVRAAKNAVDSFRLWLQDELPSRTGPSGIGIAEYDWHLKHVQLVPYTWDQQVLLIQRELERAWGYLALAENRSRALPPATLVAAEAEYRSLYRTAVRDFVEFLEREEVFTLAGFEETALLAREGSFTPPDRPREFFTQVNYRDLRPMRAHGTHWFDLARMKSDPHPSPIRSGPLLYNVWASRAEGLATGFEEMMMEAGFLTDPRARELGWVLLAQRAARALAELRMHSNEFTLEDAASWTASWTPNGWLTPDGNTVLNESQLYLEQPSYGTSYVMGKLHLDRLLAERRRQQAGSFSLRQFMDEFHASGMIPISLIRWEMTGLTDEVDDLGH